MSERLPDPRPDSWPADPGPWLRELPRGTAIARIYPAGGQHPSRPLEFRRFGPTRSRFDHHPEPPREHRRLGILYGAIAGIPDADGHPYSALTTAVAEYYQSGRIVAPSRRTDWLAVIRTALPVRLLDLGDSDWVARASGNAAIYSGPRDRSRLWARAIHERYRDIHGLVYPSSVTPPGRALALWETAQLALAHDPITWPLGDPSIADAIENVAARIGYAVIW